MSASATLRYFAKDSQGNSGPISSIAYTIVPQTTVSASPLGGTYESAQSVTLAASRSSTMFYTTDGSTPTTSSPSGSNPVAGISISSSKTLKYFAKDNFGYSSPISSITYTIIPQTTVSASPLGGTYESAQSVTLTASAPSTIFYTTDGSTPTTSSPSGSSPVAGISISSSKTLKYFAKDNFGYSSPIVASTYTILAPITVSASPSGGTSNTTKSVTINASRSATMFYTTDGTTPTTSSASGPSPLSVVISTNCTLKFFAQDSLGGSSPVSSAVYTILVPPTVSASPSGGTYNSIKSITLTASVPSTIFYTTDGSTPTTSSAYGPSPLMGVTISTNSTLKFFAKNSLGNVSPVISVPYTILLSTKGTTYTPSPQCNATAVAPSNIPSYHLIFLLQSTASPSSYSANLNLFAKYLKPGDFLFISGNYPNSTASTVLAQTQAARALVSPGVNVCSMELYFNIADLSGRATKLPKGFDYIGYDYEQGANYSPEFTTDETASIGYFDTAQTTVKNYNSITQSNARLIVTPPYGELNSANWDWGLAAKQMNTISMQTEAFLNDSSYYSQIATSLTYEIRQGSPSTQLFFQTSIDPSRGTVQENVNAINTLKTLPINGTVVYYDDWQTSDLQRLFTMLNR